MTFNAGDRVFAGRDKRVHYSGRPNDLEAWYNALLARHRFDCVVLFGCERPVHRVAVRLGERLGIPVVSLEEGYVRPGYVTAETGGNNWRSPLAGRLPETDLFDHQKPRGSEAPSSFAKMACYAAAYFAAYTLASHPRERSLFHKRRRSGLTESFYWFRNYFRKQRRLSHNFRVIQQLLETFDGRFFIVPFQVNDDSQLNSDAARGWNNETMALSVIESFARAAPPDARLVFKIHPLERGHADHWSLVNKAAILHKVIDRIDIVDSGSLGLLVRHSSGMITINSSSGLSAIHHGKPLAVLGKALYSHSTLATLIESPCELDLFWRDGKVAPPGTRQTYLEWIRAECLLPGDFYLPGEIESSLDGITSKIVAVVKAAHSNSDNWKRLPMRISV
ncbi:MAG: hypothetical protein AAF724_12140 [Pseudomonadota bacterium]